ncbi:sigma-Y antisigma factor component [Bacillus sp. DTU_2020_1000418_1_SI_GHA_SEK_038]|uniref:sigma-Y antisigma factor component n=1 Tax=Bacillus sp. DTU_2020_1000418_1_SI_GHA_SEK_038 TaxID=3077585 RepID=UPI0028EF7690|nr:sigma-Y antisigma factor component [Bacillus sp. DTU_2020_1000418_1_SI_GHA_SEK_038]WNS76734.1 sigma-Y antisigma factor component [Bacillus sp. DTU_2020_1000418_1_SI_GHA_SEK_038]
MNEEVSLPLLIVVAVILISQSTFLFTNARKHGHNYWLWGILGLIQAPVPTLVYLLFVRKLWRKKKKIH